MLPRPRINPTAAKFYVAITSSSVGGKEMADTIPNKPRGGAQRRAV